MTGRPPRRGRRLLVRYLVGSILAAALLITSVVTYVVQPFASGKANVIRENANADRLRKHVEVLAGSLAPRTEERVDLLDATANYIATEFATAGLAASMQTFDVQGRAFRNVVATIGPETTERVVVGAHYDAATPGPGADDNASGVAGLLELGRLLAANPPATRVDLVAYSLEEPPHFRTPSMGSRAHAVALAKGGVHVRAMISLEMIGYFTDQPDSQQYPLNVMGLAYPTRGDFIAVVGRLGEAWLTRRIKGSMSSAGSVPVRSINAPRAIPGIDFSDHLNYWDAGYPAVMVTDTSFYRNANYHEPSDLPSTLDYRRMATVVEQIAAAARDLAR